MNGPDPYQRYPLAGTQAVQFIKPTCESEKVRLGEYSYYSAKAGESFSSCITHHYEFLGDSLIIGKFTSIGSGIEFVMNGANHRMDGSTYPFSIFGQGWEKATPTLAQLPFKGDTVVGHDVWFGQGVTVMPGVKIGNGAIIATNSTVVKDVPPFTIVGGNPAKIIRRRFTAETIATLEAAAWWNWPIALITEHLASIACYDSPKLLQIRRSLEGE